MNESDVPEASAKLAEHLQALCDFVATLDGDGQFAATCTVIACLLEDQADEVVEHVFDAIRQTRAEDGERR